MRLDRKKLQIAMARKCKKRNDILEAGVKNSVLGRALRGCSIRPDTAGKIAQAIGVDVTEILMEES